MRVLTQRSKRRSTGSTMTYSNSPLVNYTKISPNKNSPRNHVIDTVTIHCVVGQASVERLGEIFANPSRQASANYGIGFDGKIGLYVDEKDRSWCSSSASNDHRAITIEVASDNYHPYKVTDKAYNALIELLADICKRNGIKALKWSTDKTERVGHKNGVNMTVHRDFAKKSCPGDFLYERHFDIANKVNAKLGGSALPNGVRLVTIEHNKVEKQIRAALIADENYMRLRDIEEVLGIGKVGYNAQTKKPTLTT